MTPFVFFYATSCFIAGFICLALGIYVLFRDWRPLNHYYFLLCFFLFWAGFFTALMNVAPNMEWARLWNDFSISAWLFVFAFYLRFAMVLSDVKLRPFFLVYIPPLIMFLLFVFTPYYTTTFEKTYYGYAYILGPWNTSFLLFYLIYMAIGLFFIFRVSFWAREFFKRKMARYIIVGTLVPLVVGTLFDQIFVMLKFSTFPIAIHTVAITFGIIGYAILRYQPVEDVAKEQIAEAAANAMEDLLFLTDAKKIINYANPAARRLSGYRLDELVGKGLNKLLPGPEDLLTKRGNLVKVSRSEFIIREERGYVEVVRDLTPIQHLKDSVHRMNEELEVFIRREEELMKKLFQFSRLKEPEKVKALWQEVENETEQTQVALRPVYEIMLEYTNLYLDLKQSRDKLAQKNRDIEYLNRFMAGRDKILQELEAEYERLRAES